MAYIIGTCTGRHRQLSFGVYIDRQPCISFIPEYHAAMITRANPYNNDYGFKAKDFGFKTKVTDLGFKTKPLPRPRPERSKVQNRGQGLGFSRPRSNT